MEKINYFTQNFGEKYKKETFDDSFDVMPELCKNMGGDYSTSEEFIGKIHSNKCELSNGITLLGWRDTNRIDIIEDEKDIIIHTDDVSSHHYPHDDEVNFRWGAKWIFGKEEGAHGYLEITKKRGIANIDVSESKNNTSTPVFTLYNKKARVNPYD